MEKHFCAFTLLTGESKEFNKTVNRLSSSGKAYTCNHHTDKKTKNKK